MDRPIVEKKILSNKIHVDVKNFEGCINQIFTDRYLEFAHYDAFPILSITTQKCAI